MEDHGSLVRNWSHIRKLIFYLFAVPFSPLTSWPMTSLVSFGLCSPTPRFGILVYRKSVESCERLEQIDFASRWRTVRYEWQTVVHRCPLHSDLLYDACCCLLVSRPLSMPWKEYSEAAIASDTPRIIESPLAFVLCFLNFLSNMRKYAWAHWKQPPTSLLCMCNSDVNVA